MRARLGTVFVLTICCIFLPRFSSGASPCTNPNPNPNPQSFANPGDFDGDCKSDLLWRNTSTGQVYIWFMNGTTVASTGSPGTVSSDWVIQGVGDFDGDGHADILWRNNTNGQIYIWLMNGTTIVGTGSPSTPGSDWIVQSVGDFNGDGKADILWRNTVTGELFIWVMNGTTYTSSGSLGTVPWDWSIAGVGDFDGDGKADILWWNSSTRQVSIWFMNGTSVASTGNVEVMPSGWSVAGIGDFDGNGKSDILLWNNSASQVYIWFMNGTTIASQGSVSYVYGGWTIAGIGDFSGIGKSDILWVNVSPGSDDLDIWLMDGTTLTSSGSLGYVSSNWQIDAPSGAFPFTPTTIYSYSASYDNAGNVTASSDSTYNGGSIMGSWNFSYDTLNRLESGQATAGVYAGHDLCWAYDSFGNRTAQLMQTSACPSQESGVTPTASYNSNNQLSGGLYQYDASGDMTVDGTAGNSYLYDAEGRICAVSDDVAGTYTMTGYLYDADGNRVAKGTIASMTSCDPGSNGFQLTESYVLGPSGEELTMLDGNSNWQRTNVFGGGKQLATYDSNGLHFQVTDPLGTRRVQTSAVGQPETDFQSWPFGDQLTVYPDPDAPTTADDATPLHFTGKERDAESGNDYFGARYYSSNMGRFLSPDYDGDDDDPEPLPYSDLENPQTFNLYGYVANNPLGRIDPDGHDSDDEDGEGDGQQAGTIPLVVPTVEAPTAGEIISALLSASPIGIGVALGAGPAMLFPKNLDCGCLPQDAQGNLITTAAATASASTATMAKHSKRRGSKKKTNDRHTKPRPGRNNTKDRQNPNWRPYRDYVRPKNVPTPPPPPPPPDPDTSSVTTEQKDGQVVQPQN
jgi:RHS repeat-associated protein